MSKSMKVLKFEDRKNIDRIFSILGSIFQVKDNGIVQCSICGGTTIGRPHVLAKIHHLEKFPHNDPDFPYGQDLEPLTAERINRHRQAATQIYALIHKCTPGTLWELDWYGRKQSYLESFGEVKE